MWSNMLPKPSSSELSSAKSESNNRGGVAVLVVLVVLAVTVRFLPVSAGWGREGPGDEAGDDRRIPNDMDRGGLRRKPGLADADGGTGLSLKGLELVPWTFFSDFVSMDEGFVDDVLSRVEEAALLLGAEE